MGFLSVVPRPNGKGQRTGSEQTWQGRNVQLEARWVPGPAGEELGLGCSLVASGDAHRAVSDSQK